MRRYSPLAFFLIAFLLISGTNSAQLPKIYLEPKATNTSKQSQFVHSIRFIPLTGTQFSKEDSYILEVSRNYFFLKDYSNQKLLIYSKEGKLIKEIDYKKKGAMFNPIYKENINQIEFFGSNKNYLLTAQDKIKIKLEWNKPKNRKYFKKYIIDLKDSSFILKESIPEPFDILSLFPFYGNYYWQGQINTSQSYNDSVDYEIKIYKDNVLSKTYFPYNRIKEPKFLYTQETSYFNKTPVSTEHIITRPYCDTIYKMINDSLFPIYQIVMPLENTLPNYFFNKAFKNKTERDNFNRNYGWMPRQVFNFYETQNFIFFEVLFLSNYESYIYDKVNQRSYKTKNIKTDSNQYNLQLLSELDVKQANGMFYKMKKLGDLLPFFDQHKDVPIPIELENLLKSKLSPSTPIIVQFQLKTN